MSSQGSSSARVASGAAFGPMSGDPLSREVSKPSVSSIDPAPEVTSRPIDRGAAEPEQEAVSTFGRLDDVEEETTVSYGDLESSIKWEECTRIAQEYGLVVIEPTDLDRAHIPPVGHVTLSEHYLQFGVRFPLNPFFVEVLRYFGLIIFQIMSNSWAQMIRLSACLLSREWGPPTVEEFAWFY